MKRLSLGLILTLILISLSGCGDKDINTIKYDFNNQSEFEDAILKIPVNEQALFIKNFELVAYVHGGEKKLQGFTILDIKKESIRVKKYARKENIKYLTSKIAKMKNLNQKRASIHQDHLMMSDPKRGLVYKRSYSVKELEEVLTALINRGEIK